LRAPSAGPISFWVTSCRQHQSQTTRRETGGSRLTVSFRLPLTTATTRARKGRISASFTLLFVTPKREAVAAKTADDLQNKRRRSVDPQRRASGAREFRASIGLLIQAEVQIAGFADPVLAAATPLIRDQKRAFPRVRLPVWWSSTASTVWSVDHAVVVGAGIGGLTASLVLSRVAARVTLVERAERPSEVGAALALQPNGMAVLDRLGLLPAVEAASARIDRMDIRSVTGRRLLAAEMPDLGGGLDHAIAVRRTDLHRCCLRLSPAWPQSTHVLGTPR
jgi:hypothetical protein